MRYIHLENMYRNIKKLERKSDGQVSMFFFKTIFFALIILYLQACAPALYHVNLKYEPSEKFLKSEKTEPHFLVTIAMFKDIRQTNDKLQLGTVTSMNGGRIPIFPSNAKVPYAVAMNVREYFFKSGYKLSNDIPIWDLREETINNNWGKILVGGNIDQLEIVCDDSFPVKTYQAKVKLTLVFANVSAKRIFDQISVESNSSLKNISFSEEMLEEQINAVLSDALERIFTDSKMKKKIEDESKIKS